jgi:hypothetical protein
MRPPSPTKPQPAYRTWHFARVRSGTGYGREFASVFFILQEIFDLMVKENNRFKSVKGSGNLGLESYGKAILMPTGTKNEWLD